jgi:hypothetical protein
VAIETPQEDWRPPKEDTSLIEQRASDSNAGSTNVDMFRQIARPHGGQRYRKQHQLV